MSNQRRVELDRTSAARSARVAPSPRGPRRQRGEKEQLFSGQRHQSRSTRRCTLRVSIAEETRANYRSAPSSAEVPLRDPAQTRNRWNWIGSSNEELFVEEIVAGRIRLEQWDREVEQWIYRTRLAQRLFPDRSLVSYSEDDLRVIYHEIVSGATRYSHVRNRPCLDSRMPSWRAAVFEQMAPTHWKLPSGPRMKIGIYDEKRRADAPNSRVTTEQTPRIAGGSSTAARNSRCPTFVPVITDDLQSWEKYHPEVKKDWRRYAKHIWRKLNIGVFPTTTA